MNALPTPLFRKEVFEHRADRLHGDVNLAVPVSWQVIGTTLLAAVVVAVVFLATATYSRVERVAGTVVLDRGVATIVPSRPGIVAGLSAREGQRVSAGDPLVQIRSEEDMANGRTTPQRIMAALEQQDQRLASQISLMTKAAREEQLGRTAEAHGLVQEIASIDTQIAAQQRLIQIAENGFREVQRVAGRGFISRRDLESLESELIVRRQHLLQLEQERGAKLANLAQARRAIAQADSAAQALAAGVQSTRAELVQRLAEVATAQGYTLTSPIDGTVTAMTARVGQPANQQQALMVVMPAKATPHVELYVPSSAAGFLAIGQEARVAIDAFPYQRFGTITGRLTQISSVAIPRIAANGAAEPVYLVTVNLSQPWMVAFGRKQPLLPGMTLSARIVTEKQTLLEWLFEPLFAMRTR